MKIKCSTLFDITKTNVNNRRRLLDQDPDPDLQFKINQQTNFETILQIISMRSQPEDISNPVKEQIKLERNIWGSEYKTKDAVPCWSFSFSVSHSAVFRTQNHDLGNLLADCEDVPMVTGLEEWSKLGPRLHTNTELKNITFSIVS